MKTILRAVTAITLLTGLNLSASAGVLTQDISPNARMGSAMAKFSTATAPVVVTPMPAQIVPAASLPAPTPMPAPVPMPAPILLEPMPAPMPGPILVDLPVQLPAPVIEPVSVPEPGTIATLALGLLAMGALARRRSAR